MLYINDIKEFDLDPNIKYVVKDIIRCNRYECTLALQTDYFFLFNIIDTKVLDNKICISKIDYYLDSNLINTEDSLLKRQRLKYFFLSESLDS